MGAIIFLLVILFALLDLVFIIFVDFLAVLGVSIKIIVSIFGIAIIVVIIKNIPNYIKNNQEKIKNSKYMKITKTILKIVLVLAIIITIIGTIFTIAYKKKYTPTLENYIGKYEDSDAFSNYHYLTIEKDNKCSYKSPTADFECSYDFNNDNTLSLKLFNIDENETYNFICEYEFKTIIENTYHDTDYLYCDTNDNAKDTSNNIYGSIFNKKQ